MKTIIVKIYENKFKVNGKVVTYNSQTDKWYPEMPLSIREILDFRLFLKYGKPNQQTLEKKRNELIIERTRLTDKLKKVSYLRKSVLEQKLAKTIRQLAELNFNVVVYEMV